MDWKAVGMTIMLWVGIYSATFVGIGFIGGGTSFPPDITKTMNTAKNVPFYLCGSGSNQTAFCAFFNLTADSDGTNLLVNTTWTRNTGCRLRLMNSTGTLMQDISANNSYTIPAGYLNNSQFGLEVMRLQSSPVNCTFEIKEG